MLAIRVSQQCHLQSPSLECSLVLIEQINSSTCDTSQSGPTQVHLLILPAVQGQSASVRGVSAWVAQGERLLVQQLSRLILRWWSKEAICSSQEEAQLHKVARLEERARLEEHSGFWDYQGERTAAIARADSHAATAATAGASSHRRQGVIVPPLPVQPAAAQPLPPEPEPLLARHGGTADDLPLPQPPIEAARVDGSHLAAGERLLGPPPSMGEWETDSAERRDALQVSALCWTNVS